MSGQHVVILGGGFGGATLARRLERVLPPEYRLTLVSKDNFITYNPLLAEVVGSSIMPTHVVAPLRHMLKRTDFRMLRVTGIDLEKRELRYTGESGNRLSWDHLVLAFGSTADLGLIPGLARFALPLKTIGDAIFLRNRLIVRLEQAESRPEPARRRRLLTFVVIGGGFSGVEVAGEIADFLHEAARHYDEVSARDFRILLVHSGERILPELDARLSGFATRKMRRRGIDLHLNARVVRVDEHGVELDTGQYLEAGTIVCTIGVASNPLTASLPVEKRKGRILTAPDMSVPDHPGLWALGDCASVPNASDGLSCPPTAQFATRQARALADNIRLALAGKATRPFSYRTMGQLSSIGHNKAVAQIFGWRISGFAGWLLWRAVYLMKIPTLSRKVRVFFEWNWEMLFPQDIVYLRHERSGAEDREDMS